LFFNMATITLIDSSSVFIILSHGMWVPEVSYSCFIHICFSSGLRSHFLNVLLNEWTKG
jgi:hypothetical protein